MTNVVHLDAIRPPPEGIDAHAHRQARAFAEKLDAAICGAGYTGEDAAYVASRIIAVMGAAFVVSLMRNGATRADAADMASAIANALDGGLMAALNAPDDHGA